MEGQSFGVATRRDARCAGTVERAAAHNKLALEDAQVGRLNVAHALEVCVQLPLGVDDLARKIEGLVNKLFESANRSRPMGEHKERRRIRHSRA